MECGKCAGSDIACKAGEKTGLCEQVELGRKRGVNAHGRTTFQCVIVLNTSLIVSGVFTSSILLASSSASRFRSSVFSSGLRKVECSGRGTMRNNEAIARRTVKSPSIRKTLDMLTYLC